VKKEKNVGWYLEKQNASLKFPFALCCDNMSFTLSLFTLVSHVPVAQV
jgi:hypothetical protein